MIFRETRGNGRIVNYVRGCKFLDFRSGGVEEFVFVGGCSVPQRY